MHRLHESAFRHQLSRLPGGHHNDLQILGGIEMLPADPLTVCDQITVGKIADTRRVRRDLAEKYRLTSGIAGLLEEFPCSPGCGIRICRLHASGRKLQKDLSRSMAVLAHENEVPVNGDGDHDNKIRHIIYIKRRDLRAIRQCAVIGVKIDPDGFHIMKKSEYSGQFGDYSSYSEEYEELADASLETDEEESGDEE